MIESKAPKCPGCGNDMELFQIAAGGWRYGCIACATSFKATKRMQYGWISPIKSTKDRAYAAATLATEPKWISVKDRLPPWQGKKVLVVNGHGDVRIYALWKREYGNKWTWLDERGKFNHVNDITHWMPLPEPPKEES